MISHHEQLIRHSSFFGQRGQRRQTSLIRKTVSYKMSSALQTFMHNLLLAKNGGAALELVVDNALVSIEGLPPRPQRNGLGTASGHSCSRWFSDEASPRVDHASPGLRISLAKKEDGCLPSLNLKNISSPACPIRKLSPRVDPSVFHLGEDPMASDKRSRLRKRNYKVMLPPPVDCRVPSQPKMKLDPAEPPQQPVRILSVPQATGTHNNQNHVDVPPLSSPNPWTPAEDKEVLDSPDVMPSPTNVLIRGMSGTGVKEDAPVCPIRRPSTQEIETAGTRSEKLFQTGCNSAYTERRQRPPRCENSTPYFRHDKRTRDIFVLPLAPDL